MVGEAGGASGCLKYICSWPFLLLLLERKITVTQKYEGVYANCAEVNATEITAGGIILFGNNILFKKVYGILKKLQ